ncbi:MAG TPA: R3H domain-containing nucleic acid-binding protein [Vicinamibacteria bacterium]
MKDRPFSGRDVEDALAAAGAALGLPVAALRYVVLDPGSPGRVGAKPTPARIAVMLDEPGPAAQEGEPEELFDEEDDPLALIGEMVQALAEAAGIEVAAQVAEEREAVVVRLDGPDRGFFFGEDGRGEVLRAFEHLLQRMFGPDVAPRPIRAECAGFRERRDAALAEEAHALAEAVRREGRPRTMPPLNAYERRIVHVALTEAPGVVTYSVGEGADRRVTIAPAPGPKGPESGGPEPGSDG